MNEEQVDEKMDLLLRHAAGRAIPEEPPAGFAREMAELVADQPEEAALEIYAGRALVVLAALATGACVLRFVDVSRVLHLLDRAPWPLVLTAAAALGAIKLAEVARSSHRSLR